MKMKTKKQIMIILCLLGMVLVYGNGKMAAWIKEWRMVDQDTLELTVSTPGADSLYRVKKTDSLNSTNWQEVAHADISNGTYAVTNLIHATSTSNNDAVIYVKTDSEKGFFRVDYDPLPEAE